MKRNRLLKYLAGYQCSLFREGKKHSIFINNDNGEMTAIPRHTDIKENLCRKICKDLGIPDILK